MSGLFVRSHMSAGQDGFRDKSSEQRGDLYGVNAGSLACETVRAVGEQDGEQWRNIDFTLAIKKA